MSEDEMRRLANEEADDVEAHGRHSRNANEEATENEGDDEVEAHGRFLKNHPKKV